MQFNHSHECEKNYFTTSVLTLPTSWLNPCFHCKTRNRFTTSTFLDEYMHSMSQPWFMVNVGLLYLLEKYKYKRKLLWFSDSSYWRSRIYQIVCRVLQGCFFTFGSLSGNARRALFSTDTSSFHLILFHLTHNFECINCMLFQTKAISRLPDFGEGI